MSRKDLTLPFAVGALIMAAMPAFCGTALAQAPLVLVQPCYPDSTRLFAPIPQRRTDSPVERVYPRAGAVVAPSPECYDAEAGGIASKLLIRAAQLLASERQIHPDIQVYIRVPSSNDSAARVCGSRLREKLGEALKTIEKSACALDGKEAKGDGCRLVKDAVSRVGAAHVEVSGEPVAEVGLRANDPQLLGNGAGIQPARACGTPPTTAAVLRCGIIASEPTTGDRETLQYDIRQFRPDLDEGAAIRSAAADLAALYPTLRNLPPTEPEPRIRLYEPAGASIRKRLVQAVDDLATNSASDCPTAESEPAQCDVWRRRVRAWISDAIITRVTDSDVRIVLEAEPGSAAARWIGDIVRQSGTASCKMAASGVMTPPALPPVPLGKVYFSFKDHSLDRNPCLGGEGIAVDGQGAAICRGKRELDSIVVGRIVQAAAAGPVRVRLEGHASQPTQHAVDRERAEQENDALSKKRAFSARDRIHSLLKECALQRADCQHALKMVRYDLRGHGSAIHHKEPQRGEDWLFQRVDIFLEHDARSP